MGEMVFIGDTGESFLYTFLVRMQNDLLIFITVSTFVLFKLNNIDSKIKSSPYCGKQYILFILITEIVFSANKIYQCL